MTAAGLIAFEDRVAQAFREKRIKAPIHLAGGNEEQLIDIFKDIGQQDWVFSNWRSHYHALLKGIPPDWIFDEILAGRSMYLMNKEHRFFCSAIVGGILPIACGVAMGIKRKGGDERVWAFVGDMTARTGLFHEFLQYCRGHELPVRIVVEDNGFSTNSPTEETWGKGKQPVELMRYNYDRKHPHVGLSEYVSF